MVAPVSTCDCDTSKLIDIPNVNRRWLVVLRGSTDHRDAGPKRRIVPK